MSTLFRADLINAYMCVSVQAYNGVFIYDAYFFYIDVYGLKYIEYII